MRYRWDDSENDKLRKLYPYARTADLLPHFPGATVSALSTQARSLGVRKDKGVAKSILRKNQAKATQALRGRPAWNRKPKFQLKCMTCGALFVVPPHRMGKAVCCSVECANVFKKLRTGPDHPLYTSKEAECEWCGGRFTVKQCHHDDDERGKFCSRECVGAYTTSLQGGRASSIEVAVKAELERRCVRHVGQYRIGRWSCDFYVPDLNLVIECDGDYWHSRPEVVERDKVKDRDLLGAGYKLARIAESAINSDVRAAVGAALQA